MAFRRRILSDPKLMWQKISKMWMAGVNANQVCWVGKILKLVSLFCCCVLINIHSCSERGDIRGFHNAQWSQAALTLEWVETSLTDADGREGLHLNVHTFHRQWVKCILKKLWRAFCSFDLLSPVRALQAEKNSVDYTHTHTLTSCECVC